ncbi:hemolysin XhlA [Desulfosporosinus acididurans]|uniref:Hemolysin XhlA n=1 Tax=Desulfosporosinus acididurans TaxID=476652 RepID=A0A0J1FS21_9FIRM|nr:hemolysin XhlA family protein [Desulfosporosinus acididurans]KLU66290.1 hemolysin XhlA [Desulfosporosinus acididurans]
MSGEHEDVLIDIRERLVRVETKIDTQNDLRKKVDDTEAKAIDTEARSKSNTKRLDKLEANNTWLWRTVVAAIISAVVLMYFKK